MSLDIANIISCHTCSSMFSCPLCCVISLGKTKDWTIVPNLCQGRVLNQSRVNNTAWRGRRKIKPYLRRLMRSRANPCIMLISSLGMVTSSYSSLMKSTWSSLLNFLPYSRMYLQEKGDTGRVRDGALRLTSGHYYGTGCHGGLSKPRTTSSESPWFHTFPVYCTDSWG